MTLIIETERLTRRYGRTEAVRDLTLSVPEGSIFAFVGPNGAGKTTTIKTLMNILAPSAGRARVLGVDSRALGPAQLREVGYVSENQELPLWMTLSQLTAYLAPLYPTWDAAFAEQLRRQLDLPPDRRLRDFSRGMRMKAALLSSLAYRPRLLVLDEPFAGLDALIRYEVITGILELSEQASWSVFISSHDIHEVERLADWIGIINEGRLHLSEPVPSLLGRFRQVEAVFPEGAALPDRLPPEWLHPETAGHALRFVSPGANGTAEDEARVRAVLPGAAAVTLAPMTLEAIFVTLARRFRQPAAAGAFGAPAGDAAATGGARGDRR